MSHPFDTNVLQQSNTRNISHDAFNSEHSLVIALCPVAKASCRSQIRTARAVAEELGPGKSASGGVDAWAKICLNNSERDCSKVVLKQRSRLNVPMSYLQIHGRELPWIRPKDWIQYIIDSDLWHHLAGLDDAHRHQAGEVWRSFWDKIEAMHPELDIFNEEFHLDRENTAGIYVRGDEGRSLKKSAVMVTSLQSCLGIGFSDKLRGCKRKVDGTIKHEINYRGHTYTTRFVSSIIPKRFYESDPDFYHKVMESTVHSLWDLFRTGVFDKKGNCRKICVLGVKGD